MESYALLTICYLYTKKHPVHFMNGQQSESAAEINRSYVCILYGNTIDAQINGRQLKENQYVCDKAVRVNLSFRNY